MSLSRRQFIQASGIALCAGAVPLKASAAGQQQPLPVPPLLESRRGQPLFMTVQRAHWSFTPGTRASVWGINGRYLGPTIRVWKGDDVKLIYSNRLTEKCLNDGGRATGTRPADGRSGTDDVAKR
ncbi:SufI protein [Escherichia coli]|uniref:SufI protein n=1 Tax=Escherichia coli TaxID=562 RepID=A0A3S5DVQ0_ECOLX|nr:SufI protein [Escherichia coli]